MQASGVGIHLSWIVCLAGLDPALVFRQFAAPVLPSAVPGRIVRTRRWGIENRRPRAALMQGRAVIEYCIMPGRR